MDLDLAISFHFAGLGGGHEIGILPSSKLSQSFDFFSNYDGIDYNISDKEAAIMPIHNKNSDNITFEVIDVDNYDVKHTQIISEFAFIHQSQDSIIRFANKYGLLQSITAYVPEPIKIWRHYAKNFHNAISGDKFEGVVGSRRKTSSPKKSPNFDPLSFANLVLNEHLVVDLQSDVIDQKPSLNLLAPNLISTMVIQLGLFTINRQLGVVGAKPCDRCGKYIIFGKGTGRRSTAKYCSRKCERASAYRRHGK